MPRINSETFYKNAIKKHGISAQGVCWISSAHQYIRFEVLSKLLPQKLCNERLCDAGCGFGDFYLYLQMSQNLPKEYIGIDSLTQMCDITKERTKQQTLHTDITKELLPVCDWSVCSGALNILTSYETTAFIQNCYKSVTKGFIFNVLYGGKTSSTYNYLSKTDIQMLAKTLGVREVRFEEEYLDKDITVGFYK